jgi:hypothetical protein
MADNDNTRNAPNTTMNQGWPPSEQRPHGPHNFVSVWGLFTTYKEAADAFEELTTSGFDRSAVNVILHDTEARRHSGGNDMAGIAQARVNDRPTPSGLNHALAGHKPVLTSDVGPLRAVGTMAVTLSKAGQPNTDTGGLRGGLVDFGVPAREADAYAQGVDAEGILMIVQAPLDRATQASETVRRHGAQHILAD